VLEALEPVRWHEIDLPTRPKGAPVKARIARTLREKTPMIRPWITRRLRMGSASYLSNLLSVSIVSSDTHSDDGGRCLEPATFYRSVSVVRGCDLVRRSRIYYVRRQSLYD
jgi:hypothetical protein